MDTIRTTIRVLSVLVGTLSVVSFIQSALDVGLTPLLRAFVSFYREIATAAFGLPAALLGLELPQPLVDFWTVSFLGAGAYVRTDGIERCRALRSYKLDPQSTLWKIGLFIAFGFSGLGLGIVLSAVHPLTYVDDFHEEPLDLMMGTAINVLLVGVGAIIFFVVNAFVPGA